MDVVRTLCLMIILGFTATTHCLADSQLTLTAASKSANSIVVKAVLLDTSFKQGTLTIERSLNGATFRSVASFTKLRPTSTFTDKALASGKYLYRAHVVLGRKKTRWIKTLAVTIGTSNGGGGPILPTPTPTATPLPAAFDADGNVTVSGKITLGIPAAVNANKNAGASVWSGTCRTCHTTEKYNYNYPYIKYAVRNAPMNLSTTLVTDQNVADVVAYLNRYR